MNSNARLCMAALSIHITLSVVLTPGTLRGSVEENGSHPSTSQSLPVGQTLREAAGKRLLVGCAVATVDLQDPKLSALIAEQFDCITPEYEFMPEHLVDDRGKFTFERGDAVVAFAEKHQMPVFGHMLVWNFVTRNWFFASPDGKPLPRDKALANLKAYIDAVMLHYKGRIKVWDVVNEAISDKSDEYLTQEL